jgi:hypothetical protein
MRRLLAAVAVLTLTACINDSVGVVGTRLTGSDPASTTGIAGTYTLKTVNGKPLPFTYLETATEKRETIDDALTLTNTNSWTRFGHIRRTVDGTATLTPVTDAGTYSRSDLGAYTFIADKQAPFTGTIVNGVMSLSVRDLTGQLVPAIFSK